MNTKDLIAIVDTESPTETKNEFTFEVPTLEIEIEINRYRVGWIVYANTVPDDEKFPPRGPFPTYDAAAATFRLLGGVIHS